MLSHLNRMLKPRQKAMIIQSKSKIDYLNANSSIIYSKSTVLEIWTNKVASFLLVLALQNVRIGWCIRNPCDERVFQICLNLQVKPRDICPINNIYGSNPKHLFRLRLGLWLERDLFRIIWIQIMSLEYLNIYRTRFERQRS